MVAIEDFYVAIELTTTKSSATHDRAGRMKVGVHDSVASCCVATEEAMRTWHTRPGARDKLGQACTTGLGCARQRCGREKGIMSRQRILYRDKKKKMTLRIWGVTAWYQSLGL